MHPLVADILHVVSWAAILGGSFFYVVGAIGLNRMPDVFSRMHAVSVSESLGVGLLILGMLLQAVLTLVSLKLMLIVAVKLIIILVVLMWTGSVATHALARAALHDGEKPMLADESGKLAETDVVSLFPELAVRLAEPLTSETVDEDAPEAQPGSGA